MSGTKVLDPEATKVCGVRGGIPVRYSQYPASAEVLSCPDFSISAEQLLSADIEIEQRVALGEHPALAVFQLSNRH